MTKETTPDKRRALEALGVIEHRLRAIDGILSFEYEYETIRAALSAPVDKEVVEASKRGNYAWSEGGEYTAQDWKNEGAIELAQALLRLRGGGCAEICGETDTVGNPLCCKNKGG